MVKIRQFPLNLQDIFPRRQPTLLGRPSLAHLSGSQQSLLSYVGRIPYSPSRKTTLLALYIASDYELLFRAWTIKKKKKKIITQNLTRSILIFLESFHDPKQAVDILPSTG